MKIEELYKYYKQHFLVDTDTRSIRKNTIFFALKGPNFNGNAFAEKALDAGAIYSIVEEPKYVTKPNILLVENVLQTLQKLANYHRKQLNIPIIGLTGSNGKTTTKELLNTVLSKKYKTVATVGNLNNHIGVPLTLLSMNAETEIGIVEMGANHQKEIELLTNLCEPNFGYITNFGKAHLEGFGGIEGVIKGKSELYTYLKNEGGIAIVNPNDKIQLEKTNNIKRIFFEKKLILKKATPFVAADYKGTTIESKLVGTYNFANICAAITVGHHLGISPGAIKEALESYVPSNNRSQIIKKGTHTIVLDAYNANPTSMKAAIESFKTMEGENKVLILGDMFELGKYELEEHQKITILLKSTTFKKVYLIGELFHKITTDYLKFKEFSDFKNHLKTENISNCTILVKGSRGMQLERVLELLN
ncbi:UDP-N-acetylmuramoyl-tripeptide--D-alanyl-D-alanine ligase [Polaribacter sp.]|nr:UDP-N-acetylmuramoyl-tripeptide--D-alanyl-D-alanine ligase [Polaribacter sp.]MDB4167625.1 UDP-N-acetylmuramoyl-tripeptide--D-alanyl-D-alanine ligase [Polaribacter sp.]